MSYFYVWCFSLPKNSALIEREEGQQYAPLFMALRLHGITDSKSNCMQLKFGVLKFHFTALLEGIFWFFWFLLHIQAEDHFLLISYGSKWPLCVSVPLNTYSFIYH